MVRSTHVQCGPLRSRGWVVRLRRRRSRGGGAARIQAMAGVFDIDLDQPEDAGSDEELEEGALNCKKFIVSEG
uniref:Uncharacterized protein n=1 Tax=Chelonoidis abingdonii TaxID=106734 RepID=A0A8C0GP89_CHEAB